MTATGLKRLRSCSFTLIEVVLAVAILSLSLVPLLYPHFAIMREEQEFVREVTLDREVNNLHFEELKRYYSGEINWEQEWEAESEFDETVAGYKVKRGVHIAKKKPDNTPLVYLVETRYTFSRGKKKQEYSFYDVVTKKHS